ncbi:MAG: NAD-dependent epimerase/dehydratase family protein [Candidatus Heimdallarchaeota archaeon]
MRVLVTGASGFLGGHLVKELLSRDYHVKALVRKTSDTSTLEKTANLQLVYGDLTNSKSIIDALTDVELIFHNGAFFEEWAPYKKFHLHNVLGTKNVLDAALTKNIDRIIYTSTADIYQYSDDHALTETSEKQVRGNYQKSKIEAEKLIDS